MRTVQIELGVILLRKCKVKAEYFIIRDIGNFSCRSVFVTSLLLITNLFNFL